MIRVDLDEQTAVEVHHALGVLRQLLGKPEFATAHAAVRDTQLAIAGGLRAVGWTPADGGWDKRTGRSRR